MQQGPCLPHCAHATVSWAHLTAIATVGAVAVLCVRNLRTLDFRTYEE